MRRLWAVIVVVIGLTISARGDTLEKTSGQKLEGRVVAETPDQVTFEVVSGGITFTQRVPRGQIRKLERESREGPGYCAIPLIGDVGVEITAKAFAKALAEARRFKPDYVILVIDSNGGLISERDKVVGVLRQNQDLRIIAYVQKAYSAAATIALACPDLYMAPEGAIGAAVAYRQTPRGVPELLAEKFRSTVRASERSASEMGKRSDLWIRGMTDGDLELSIISEDECGPRIVEGNPEGSTRIKRKGEILTVNAREAVEWGLAAGSAGSVDALKEPLGLKVWHNEDKRPWQMMADSSRIERQHFQEKQEAMMRRMVRGEYMRQTSPELASLLSRLEKARAQLQSAQQAIATLKSQYQAEKKAIDEEYQRATAGSRNAVVAQTRRNKALTELQNRYRPQFVSYEEKRNQAQAEVAQISQRLKSMVANLPPE